MFVEGYLFSLNRWYISDKTPLSFEKDLLLFSSELELLKKDNCKMNKLIIDAAKNNIFCRKNAKKQKMTEFQNLSKTMFSTSGNVTTSFLSTN